MIIEAHRTPPPSAPAQPQATGPVVALLGPAVSDSVLTARLSQAGAVAVPLTTPTTAEDRAAVVIAALACDLAVLDLPASLGLDSQTPLLWERLGSAGLPRVVVVSGLDAATADFDDLAAIAQRVLGEDSIPVRLPVFDDDGHTPVASLDLARATLNTADGAVPAEDAHLEVAAGDLSALLSVVAATVPDDAAADDYMRLLGRYAEASAPRAPESDGTTMLGMPAPGRTGGLPSRLPRDVASAVAEGTLVPIVADTAEGAWVDELGAWAADAGTPADRLVRRDADGTPADGWAAVVLALSGGQAMVRPVYGTPGAGYALITAVGSDVEGAAVPHRAWPTELNPADGTDEQPGISWWTSAVRMSVGDTVASGHAWLVPAE